MACCGGARAYTPASALTASVSAPAAPVRHTRWKITYPNGADMEFDHEWQVRQAQAMSGGVVEELPPDVGDTPDTTG
jgi:hypothetical protein